MELLNPISNGKLSPGSTFHIDQILELKRKKGRNLNNDKLMADDFHLHTCLTILLIPLGAPALR